ncbi:hypothetical protein SDC9_161912 [bioreactor metagenome]|uniref:Uncharacterized protein n=1 Tax=bioreactor metagenome TaxID=1076179 RepID=A0A645FJL0_9ZZZZ
MAGGEYDEPAVRLLRFLQYILECQGFQPQMRCGLVEGDLLAVFLKLQCVGQEACMKTLRMREAEVDLPVHAPLACAHKSDDDGEAPAAYGADHRDGFARAHGGGFPHQSAYLADGAGG